MEVRESVFRGLSFSFIIKLLAKGVGLLKNIIFATSLGLSLQLDFFSIAMGILVMYFAFNEAFDLFGTPAIIRNLQESVEKGIKQSQKILMTSLYLSLFISMVMLLNLDFILEKFASGVLAENRSKELKVIAQIMMLGGFFSLPIHCLASSFRAFGKYTFSYFPELLISIGTLVSYLLFFSSPQALAISYSIGQGIGFLFLLISFLVFAYRSGGSTFRSLSSYLPSGVFLKGLISLLPIILMNQAYVMYEKRYGSFLAEGKLSALNIAMWGTTILMTLPAFQNIFIAEYSRKSKQETLEVFLKGISIFSIPAVVFLIVFCEEFLNLLVGYGKIDSREIHVIKPLFQILTLGVFFNLSLQIFQRIFYSLNKPYHYYIPHFSGMLLSIAYLLLIPLDSVTVENLAYYNIIPSLCIFASSTLLLKRLKISLPTEGFAYAVKLSILCVVLSCALVVVGNQVENLFFRFSIVFISYLLSLLYIFHKFFNDPFSQKLKTKTWSLIAR